MPNLKITLTEKQRKEVAEEINEKVKKYESKMCGKLSRWSEIAELYSGKSLTKKENSVTTPNSPELYKAIRSLANIKMRMLLGQKPFFELQPMDILAAQNWENLVKIEHYVLQQSDLANLNKNLYKSLVHLLLYGTTAIHNPYISSRASFLGRKNNYTAYRPVSMINCAFSLDSYDIEEAAWIALNDIQSKRELHSILKYDIEEKLYDKSQINKAIEQKDYKPEVNTWVNQRMAWQGFVDGNFENGIERTTYYGPLEALDDGNEYTIEMVNREFIIRCEICEGLKPVRIAAINQIDVEPLGNGLGDVFLPLLKTIDSTESAMLNMITLAGANMFTKQKSLMEEDAEWTIRNFGIIGLENPQINSISPDPNNLIAVSQYKDYQIQKFRQASGATDNLQAIVSNEEATATQTTLAMNEAVRNASVQAEIIAPSLLRDYVKIVIQNAIKYNTQPLVVNIDGTPSNLFPSDFLLDLDVRIKTTTDQDFKPARQRRLVEALTLMSSTGPNAIPGKVINLGPTLLEYLKTLDIPKWNESIKDITEEDLMNMSLISQMQNPQAKVPAMEQEEEERLTTPAGDVLSAPGDDLAKTETIKSSGVL